MKMSSFIIAMILVGVVATTFTMMIVDLSTSYGVVYDQDTLDVFNDTTELIQLAAALENKTTKQNVESGILDVVGAYIGRALDTLKLSMTSFTVFERMAGKATDKVGLPSYFLAAFISIMLILIIIGVIVSAMVKKDL